MIADPHSHICPACQAAGFASPEYDPLPVAGIIRTEWSLATVHAGIDATLGFLSASFASLPIV